MDIGLNCLRVLTGVLVILVTYLIIRSIRFMFFYKPVVFEVLTYLGFTLIILVLAWAIGGLVLCVTKGI